MWRLALLLDSILLECDPMTREMEFPAMSRHRLDLRTLEPKRVCLIKPSSLGDVVHALPVLAALRDLWPGAHFAWVINKGLRGLVDEHPLLDEVIPFDRAAASGRPSGIRYIGRFLDALRQRRFDVAIDLQGLLRSGIMTGATGARTRIGLANAREGAGWFYTHRTPDSPDRRHAVDRLMAVAEMFGAEISNPRFVLAFDETHRDWARSSLAEIPKPRLVVNVGARWLTKRWPPEHFASVAERAATLLGAGIIAVGATEDRPLIDALRARLTPHPVLDLGGRTTLPHLAALAAEADLFLSNDTGPLHLAAATGTPVLGVYTCTRPEWTGPHGRNAQAVRSEVWCAGSCVKTCPRLECMTELSPDRVWQVVAEILTRSATRQHVPPAA